MSALGRMFLAQCGALLLICSCARSSESSQYSAFFQCWGFVNTGSRLYELDFEALVYPRGGVISYNTECPELRLDMVFNDTVTPPGFRAIRDDYSMRIQLLGLRGRAVVFVDKEASPNMLTVTVRRLISGDVLADEETRRIWETTRQN